MALPRAYAWLADEPAPKMLVEAVKLYGVKEVVGPKHSETLLAWGKEVKAAGYSNDEIPWCGLFIAVIAKRAGWDYTPGGNALWARNWSKWGNKAASAMLGDVLVFSRGSGGHVGLYVGEDDTAYHVLGGNQGNEVNISRVAKARCIAIRRAPWKKAQPKNVRKVKLVASGALSKNEA